MTFNMMCFILYWHIHPTTFEVYLTILQNGLLFLCATELTMTKDQFQQGSASSNTANLVLCILNKCALLQITGSA
jgi:hypothetical protein